MKCIAWLSLEQEQTDFKRFKRLLNTLTDFATKLTHEQHVGSRPPHETIPNNTPRP